MHQISRLPIYLSFIAALFLQTTIVNYVSIAGAKPDLVLICVIFYALFLRGGIGTEVGLVAGLLKDTLSLDYFGINMFVLGLTGFFVSLLSGKFSKESRVTQFLLVVVFTAFSMTLHFTLASIFSKYLNIRFSEIFFSSILPTSTYTSLVSIPIFSRLLMTYRLKRADEFL